jgi:hypothetical protein
LVGSDQVLAARHRNTPRPTAPQQTAAGRPALRAPAASCLFFVMAPLGFDGRVGLSLLLMIVMCDCFTHTVRTSMLLHSPARNLPKRGQQGVPQPTQAAIWTSQRSRLCLSQVPMNSTPEPQPGLVYHAKQLARSSSVNRFGKIASNLAKISSLCFAIWMLAGLAAPASAMSKVAATLPVEQAATGGGLAGFLHFVLHLDKELAKLIASYGKAIYAILFGIVFCETGQMRMIALGLSE